MIFVICITYSIIMIKIVNLVGKMLAIFEVWMFDLTKDVYKFFKHIGFLKSLVFL